MNIEIIQKLLNDSTSVDLLKFLNALKKTKLPSFFAKDDFGPFNPEDITDRKRDQLDYGFPYTSSKWPWPVGFNDVAFQPVLQLDLIAASQRLDFNLGNGILQVWVNPNIEHFIEEYDNVDHVIRVVPRNDLDESPSLWYPKDAPWLHRMEEKSLVYMKSLESPRILWEASEFEFPDYKRFIDDISAESGVLNNLTRNLSSEFIKLVEEIYDEESLEINSENFFPQLGGYTRSWGGMYFCDCVCIDSDWDKLIMDDKKSLNEILLFHSEFNHGDLICGFFVKASDINSDEVKFSIGMFGYAH